MGNIVGIWRVVMSGWILGNVVQDDVTEHLLFILGAEILYSLPLERGPGQSGCLV